MKFQIGCHVSIAGGVFNAPKMAAGLGCETFQIFSRSPQGGPAPKLTKEVLESFKEEMGKYNLSPSLSSKGEGACFVIHAPYYINFGSPKPATYKSSIAIVRDELERGTLLGAKFVMFHPGSLKDNEEKGFAQAQKGLVEVLKNYKGTTELLIEISAGAGAVLGDTFEEVRDLMKPLLGKKGFGGICFDTQHAFGSGYDLRTEKSALEVLKQFDKIIGLKFLRMSHVNDSKVELGSHKDRHEHIGQGKLGKAGIMAFLKALDSLLSKSKNDITFPLILETDHDRVKEDIKILKKLRDSL